MPSMNHIVYDFIHSISSHPQLQKYCFWVGLILFFSSQSTAMVILGLSVYQTTRLPGQVD